MKKLIMWLLSLATKTPNFANQMSEITKTFTDALESSRKLSDQMDKTVAEKQKEVDKILQQMNSIQAVKAQNEKFAQNVAKIFE